MRQVQIGDIVTALAGVLVWVALVLPNAVGEITVWAFVRVPLGALVIVALALILPPRARRFVAIGAGGLLGMIACVKILDMGFHAVLDRPFDALNDWSYFGPAVDVLDEWIGTPGAVLAVIGAALLVVAALLLLPMSVLRLTRVASEHRHASGYVVTVLGVAWVLCALAGVRFSPGVPVASANVAGLTYDHAREVRNDLHDRHVFAAEIDSDRFAERPADQLLTALRGKDVLFVFVESYGRVAVEDPTISPPIDALLDDGTRRLRVAGFSARSAYLTSPTFGAGSWLAHATLQSGLWVDSDQRYDQLLTEDRLTLTSAFEHAGWRTVFALPADDEQWPEGESFYRIDALYDSDNLDYRGPDVGWGDIPDQFTLAALQRRELADIDRPPVMAEVDLVSSHHPWAQPPPLVDWERVGDGSAFDCTSRCGDASPDGFGDADGVRTAYGATIEYSLRSLISFVETYPDPDRVLVMVGDHQPHSYVTGDDASHDVPITIIAADPAVMRRISSWGWDTGMNPSADAPVWPMDAFRDRFLTAFGPSAP